jgi:hypothetical protein
MDKIKKLSIPEQQLFKGSGLAIEFLWLGE